MSAALPDPARRLAKVAERPYLSLAGMGHQATFVVKVKDFAGKTKEGIGMGASAAEIIKAYGEPDATEKEEDTTRLLYRKKLGLEFTLGKDKLVQFSLSPVRYPDAERQEQFANALLSRIEQLPGVTAAGISFSLPLSNSAFGLTFAVTGRPEATGPEAPAVSMSNPTRNG